MTDSLYPMSPASPPELEATSGAVTFVGSGPGDLGLLTLSGSRALRFADVIVVDPGIDVDAVRQLVAAHAQIRVSRGNEDTDLILHSIGQGLKVVRLHRGDYFTDADADSVLADVLSQAGLYTNVVPGVNRWSAALSYGAVIASSAFAALDVSQSIPEIDDWPTAQTLIVRAKGIDSTKVASVASSRFGRDGAVLSLEKTGTTAQISDVMT